MEMWKVRIDVKQSIIEKELPKEAIIKNVISHKGYVQICFECDPSKEKEVRKFKAYMGGQSVFGIYLGSAVWQEGLYHIYECVGSR